MPITSAPPPPKHVFDIPDDDDEEEWQEMPVVREDEFAGGLDEEDQKKYHYRPSFSATSSNNGVGQANTANATGNLIDVDDSGNEWRSKLGNEHESEYTRVRVREEEDAGEEAVHMRTRYLFDEDAAMTPLSQMQATKKLLTEAQRIAYVGVCQVTTGQMAKEMGTRKELKSAAQDVELWAMKIMGRLYYHMEIETQEQKMIQSLAEHGVRAEDLVPSLMTTHTVANPEYDPEEAQKKKEEQEEEKEEEEKKASEELKSPPLSSSSSPTTPTTPSEPPPPYQTTQRVLEETTTSTVPGVSTSLSSTDQQVTLDIRWTVLCDLFLVLIADSVFDARSRVLLERVALHLGLGWLDVVRFEARVTDALYIQEDIDNTDSQYVIEANIKRNKRKRYMMLGLATLGGGLVIGLSAGLLAPVIGAGIGAAFTTVGITGTSGFLAGAGGVAVITSAGTLTGSSIAARGMVNRTQQVRTFQLLPLHNNKRVNCILTVPGFLNGAQDDPRLPYSVLDPVVGDVFSVLWEPEMIQETGGALKILTGEVLTQLGQTVLSATVMATLMSALQWPIVLTKLGYLIDNPWNNALDRARAAGGVLADVLMQRHLGVRPITLIGFSLGARVIWYALLELAKRKCFGVVQDVFLLGTTLSASSTLWTQTRSVVAGRYVNAFARNDWVLNYLFRATSAGVGTVAGLRPVEGVPGLENVDVTDKIAGHMSYRTFMPLILDQLGFPVSADHFDEPEEPDFEGERIVERPEGEKPMKRGWFSRKDKPVNPPPRPPPSDSKDSSEQVKEKADAVEVDEDLPPREAKVPATSREASLRTPTTPVSSAAAAAAEKPISQDDSDSSLTPSASTDNLPPPKAGFDFAAIKEIIGDAPPPSAISSSSTSAQQQQLEKELQPVSAAGGMSMGLVMGRAAVGRTVSMPLPDAPATPSRMFEGDEAGNEELTPKFGRGLSLDDEESPYSTVAASSTPSLGQFQHPTASSSLNGWGAYSSPTSTMNTGAEALSFGGSDGSVWDGGAGVASAPGSGGFGAAGSWATNPFSSPPHSSSSTTPFSMSPVPSSPFSSQAAPPIPNSSNNPYSNLGFQRNNESTLSFGGVDGSISNQTQPYPSSGGGGGGGWALPPLPKKKSTLDFASNPWS